MIALTPGLKVKLESVRKLIRRNSKVHLEKLLNKLHPADIAIIHSQLSDLERSKLWGFITDIEKLALVITELQEHDILAFFEGKDPKYTAMILSELEADDASTILRLLPEDVQEKALSLMGHEELAEVEKLMTYDDDRAGAIMNTSFFALVEDITVKEATKMLHKADDLEMVFYLYVTDGEGRLSGVVSLRQLILNQPDKLLKDIMAREVIHVNANVDQEDVAKIVEKYDLLAVPVVDDYGVLTGIITVDDVIDIIREEATEDIFRMAGTSDDELMFGHNSLKIAKIRLPWLMVTFFGGLLASGVVAFFQGRVEEFTLLVPFLPPIMAMGGNVGSQSATIIIRGVALGKIDTKDIVQVVLKEIRVGMLMGLVCGILVGCVAPIWSGKMIYGLIVGVAMFSAMTIASITGAVVPTTLIRMNFDPAVASSPFISMLNDMTGIAVYFSISMLLLSHFA